VASKAFDDLVGTLRNVQRVGNPTVAEMREGWEKFAGQFPPAKDLRFESVDADGVPGEWSRAPGIDESRVVLFLHGGGYNIGSIASYRDFTGRISRACAARVLSVGYRLAPEFPFPAAVDDAVAAYRWLRRHGVVAQRILFAGDSAGGGLVLAALVKLRDAGEDLPAAAMCVSPSTDLAKEGESMHTKADVDPVVRYDTSMAHALRYVGEKGDLKHPLASPLYADMRGLPPLLILVGTNETLLDDSTRVADKARAAGVDVAIEIWDDMIHIWPFFAAILPEGQQAIERMGKFARAQVASA
jgi:monoterpene epsilon-lactone hydrolase